MKKISLLLVFVLLMTLASCTKKEVVKVEEPVVKQEVELVRESEFYLNVSSNERPVAVMIDNDNKDAWPHSGIDEAYLVYEMFVEGGATRMMALFKGVDTKKIGPVRSSRHYFIDYVMENDAIYVHFGQSPVAGRDLVNLNINNINGVSDGGVIFWREYKYKNDWHSAYTSIEKIKDMADKKGYRNEIEKFNLNFAKNDVEVIGESKESFMLDYSNLYRVEYTYLPEKDVYQRTLNGSTIHQSKDGVLFAPKNVIVQFANNFDLGDGTARQDIATVGNGEGYYFSKGKMVKINWQKNSRSESTKYTLENGDELSINPGQTFINIIPKPNFEI